MVQRSLAQRLAHAEELAGRYLADANEASERGDDAKAERLYAKGQYWHDRVITLSGDGDRPKRTKRGGIPNVNIAAAVGYLLVQKRRRRLKGRT